MGIISVFLRACTTFIIFLHCGYQERSYCRIVTPEKDYLLTMPMKRLEDKLPPEGFQRIHRSHIVNLLRVDEVTDGMVRIDKELLTSSIATRGEFMRRLNAVCACSPTPAFRMLPCCRAPAETRWAGVRDGPVR